jgi:hypothetical protein
VKSLVLIWLRWRYGGKVRALKPPLGYHRIYSPRSLWWICGYKIRRGIFAFENFLFNRYGQAMRDEWEQSC